MFTPSDIKKIATHTSTRIRPNPVAPTPTQSSSKSLAVPKVPGLPRKNSAPATLAKSNGVKPNGVKSKSGSPKGSSKSASPAIRSVQIQSKRKSAVPSPRTPTDRIQWSESEDEDEEEDLILTKKPRIDNGRVDLKRIIWDLGGPGDGKGDSLPIIDGASLTKNDTTAKYISAFPLEPAVREVELQYPSFSRPERFQLVGFNDTAKNHGKDREKDEYDPIDDLLASVETICKFYFPPDQSKKLLGISDDFEIAPANGFPQRLRRELNRDTEKRSFPEFLRVLNEFNQMVRSSLKDTTPTFLKERHSVPLELVERILTQSYSRTVSLKVSSLKEYTNGTDNVYGELLPRFVDKILKETQVDSTHVFADLGSGVGNVVLQTALQTGCEAWGIEMMPNPAGLARKQLREFRARCRLWGIRPGRVRLLHGSFLDPSSPINDVFKRADKLLINNFAFQPVTNDELKLKFMELKEGCQIAHLKPFKSHAKINSSNFGDVEHILQHERKLEYFSDSVSWGAPNGRWYVVTIDRKPLSQYMEKVMRSRG